jgi:hypothetical protein
VLIPSLELLLFLLSLSCFSFLFLFFLFSFFSGIFDAHSIWHGLTIPLGFMLYSFYIDDAIFETAHISHQHI